MQQLREVAKGCTDPSSEAQVEHQKDAEDAEDGTFKKSKGTAECGIYSATFKLDSPFASGIELCSCHRAERTSVFS
jgi:hypothetical protein